MSRLRCINGKVRHASKSMATAAHRRIRNAGLDIYRCQICQGWHLGTSRSPHKQQARIDQLLTEKSGSNA